MIKQSDQEQLEENRVRFSWNSQVTLHYKGKSGQELQAGTEAEGTGEHCLLACPSCLAQPVFLVPHSMDYPEVALS